MSLKAFLMSLGTRNATVTVSSVQLILSDSGIPSNVLIVVKVCGTLVCTLETTPMPQHRGAGSTIKAQQSSCKNKEHWSRVKILAREESLFERSVEVALLFFKLDCSYNIPSMQL